MSLVVAAAPASAVEPEPPPRSAFSLRWTAPAECPQAADVEQSVRQILGGPARPEPPLQATVTVWRDETGSWRARVTTEQGDEAGERELIGERCSEITHAITVVLALMVAPAANTPPPPDDAQAFAPSPPSAPAPHDDAQASASSPPSAPAPQNQSSTRPWLLRSEVSLGMGFLPGLDAGASLHVGVASDSLSGELRLGAWLPRMAYSDVEPSMGAELWAFAATPVACVRWHPGPSVRLDTCAGVGVAQVHARGVGMSDPTSLTTRCGVARMELAVALALSRRVGLRPSAEAAWPLSRPSFAIEHVGDVHRAEKMSISGGLAVELGF